MVLGVPLFLLARPAWAILLHRTCMPRRSLCPAFPRRRS